MPSNIYKDWFFFRGIISKQLRKDISKYIHTGSIYGLRPKDGKTIRIPLPKIEQPYICFADNGEGVGRGPGKPGDQISPPRGNQPGGGRPGEGTSDGMLIDINMDDIWDIMKEELELPDMLPKPNPTHEETKIIYDGLSKSGPRALVHKRKTMLGALKRLASMGNLEDVSLLPKMLGTGSYGIINDDIRYRQYNERRVPSSNAVIFFLRDGSGSMGGDKCEIASDIAFWLKLYISKFYDKTQIVYIWHDYEARELGEHDFFSIRDGGGTLVSSSFKLMKKIIKERYPVDKWNIYGFYFGDGENHLEDNKLCGKMLRNELSSKVVNMFGQVEIMNSMKEWGNDWQNFSLKAHLDDRIKQGHFTHVRNTEVEGDAGSYWKISNEKRYAEIKKVIKQLLGKPEVVV